MQQEFVLDPAQTSVAEARRHARELLAGRVDGERVAEVELVVSELVTNAVRHGPAAPIHFRIAKDDAGDVIGEVEDQGSGSIAIRETDPETALGGRGLPIVDALASAWGVYPGRTHVWFRFAS